jgi:hypothetical protein
LKLLDKGIRVKDLHDAVQDHGVIGHVAEPVESTGWGLGVQAPSG